MTALHGCFGTSGLGAEWACTIAIRHFTVYEKWTSEDEIMFDEVHAYLSKGEYPLCVSKSLEKKSGAVATAKYSRVYSINSYMCLLIHTCVNLDMLNINLKSTSTVNGAEYICIGLQWGYNIHY